MIWGGGGNTAADYGKGGLSLSLEDVDEASDVHAEEISARLKVTFLSPDNVSPLLPAAAVEVHRLSQALESIQKETRILLAKMEQVA